MSRPTERVSRASDAPRTEQVDVALHDLEAASEEQIAAQLDLSAVDAADDLGRADAARDAGPAIVYEPVYAAALGGFGIHCEVGTSSGSVNALIVACAPESTNALIAWPLTYLISYSAGNEPCTSTGT